MKRVVNMMRIWVRPWWAKVVAVVVILSLCVLWYGCWVYLGYARELRVYRLIEGDSSEGVLPKDGVINVQPDLVQEYLSGLAVYGRRIHHLRLKTDDEFAPELLGELGYLKKLQFGSNWNKTHDDDLIEGVVKHAHSVEHVDLDAGFLKRELCEKLVRLAELKRVTVHLRYERDEEEVEGLKALSMCDSIEELEFKEPLGFFGDFTEEEMYARTHTVHLQALAGMKGLKALRFEMQFFSEADAVALNAIPNLAYVDLAIRAPSQASIEAVGKVTRLKGLRLGEVKAIGGDGWPSGDESLALDLSTLRGLGELESLSINCGKTEGLNEGLANKKHLIILDVTHVEKTVDLRYLKQLGGGKLLGLYMYLEGDAQVGEVITDEVVADVGRLDRLIQLNLPEGIEKVKVDEIGRQFKLNAGRVYAGKRVTADGVSGYFALPDMLERLWEDRFDE